MYLGDFAEDGDIFFKFTTRAFATGIPTTLAGTPVLSVYKDEGGAATEKTTAEAYFDLDVDHDSIGGWHNVRVDLSGDAFFATGADYAIVITTGTVDSVSVAGENIATFSIENRSMGQPAGATLAADVAAIKAETALIVADTGTDGVVVNAAGLATDAVNEIADGVWDEATSGHVTTGSFGVLGELIQTQGVVETSGSNSSTQVQTDLAEATNDHYDVMTIFFLDGAEAGQSRLITGYTGATGVVAWNAALTGTPADGTRFAIISAGTTADAVWDEILTGSSHNISTSAGRRLRQIEEAFVHANGTIATVTNGHTFTLDAGAVATADFYIGDRLQITEGTGAGQSRVIIAYSSGRVAILDSDYVTNPDTSSLYEIDAADVHVSVSDADLAEGFVAVATSTTTITLDSTNAVATTDYYKGDLIVFTHGTGAGQSREITAYTSGRVVTMSPALETAVSTNTVWHIQAAPSIAETVDEVWDEARADHATDATMGQAMRKLLDIDVDDTTVANVGSAMGQIDDIQTDTADIQSHVDPVTGTGTSLASNGLDNVVVETGVNARQALSILSSAIAGVLSGAGTTTITIRAVENEGTTRVVATVDGDGNRSALTLTLPA